MYSRIYTVLSLEFYIATKKKKIHIYNTFNNDHQGYGTFIFLPVENAMMNA